MSLLGSCPRDVWLFRKELRSCNITCSKFSLHFDCFKQNSAS
uniref:Uncharacterized protein n=1 Tax=Aegilops tauschii subsp. strangulata TaxID=200361 RepID=A0A453P5L5_AEGTS